MLLPEAREDSAEAEQDADSKLTEVIEWQLDSEWTWVPSEEIGALTNAPILSDTIEYDNEGEVVRVGGVYWYLQYDVADPVAQLLARGYLEFEQVQ